MWVRGLKHEICVNASRLHTSHPMWVRGLKPIIRLFCLKVSLVAPYVGAWIETANLSEEGKDMTVAPYVGAWIETLGNAKEDPR